MTAEEITAALGGRWSPTGYGKAGCPAHGGEHSSLTVKDDPTEPAGIFAICHVGCHPNAVRAALAGLGLVPDGDAPAPEIDPEILRKKKAAEAERRKTSRRNAQWLWDIANPAPSPMTVARYLLARDIDLARLGGLPACLRFQSQAQHFGSNITLPAMVAAIVGPDGEHFATHFTYLNGTCSGKTTLDPDKIIVGPPTGGAIRLFPMPPDGALGLAEGIESALSAAELHNMPVWSLANTSVMKRFEPPAGMTRAVIFADHDSYIPALKGRPGALAGMKLARRLSSAGIPCRIIYPADGMKDFNDELTARKRNGRAA
jgi:putative DNA primase/helicase